MKPTDILDDVATMATEYRERNRLVSDVPIEI